MGGAHLEGMEGLESRIGGCSEGDPPRAPPQLADAAQIRVAAWAGWASGALPAAQLLALGFLRPSSPEKALQGFSILGEGGCVWRGRSQPYFLLPRGDYGPQRHCAFCPIWGRGYCLRVSCVSCLPCSLLPFAPFARYVPLGESSVTCLCRYLFNRKM